MSPVTLRAAEPADGTSVAQVQLEAWRDTYGRLNPAMVDGLDPVRTAQNWARAATDPTHRLSLAERDGIVIGYALSGPAEDEPEHIGELHSIYLLPSAQGAGAGRLLVADALAWLAATERTECILWVAEQNPRARGFYSHLGFEDDGGRNTWRGLAVVRYRTALSSS